MHVMHPLLHRLLRRRVQRTASRHIQARPARTVNIVREVQDALFGVSGRLQQRRARPVSKQYAGGSVLIIQNGRHHVAADRQHLPVRTCSHKLRPHRQRVHKPAARRRQVKPHAPFAPSRSCTRHAVAGNIMSGVTLATTIISISSGSVPVWASTLFAASVARCDAATPVSATCSSRIPVRVRIHSSLVSTSFSRSRFVITRGGAYPATPVIFAGILLPVPFPAPSPRMCNWFPFQQESAFYATCSRETSPVAQAFSFTLSVFAKGLCAFPNHATPPPKPTPTRPRNRSPLLVV